MKAPESGHGLGPEGDAESRVCDLGRILPRWRRRVLQVVAQAEVSTFSVGFDDDGCRCGPEDKRVRDRVPVRLIE